MKLEIKIFANAEETALHIAGDIAGLVQKNSGNGRETYLAVAGGSTPKLLFKLLSENFKDKIEWKMLHLFWGDERCVPPEDGQSNYGMTKKYLLDKIEIPDRNIHRIRGEEDPGKEVSRIASEINQVVPNKNNLPRFDLAILGLGKDGHTASLFPGKKLKYISEKIAGVATHPESAQKRISLTPDVINNSAEIIFMVTGERKADIIFKIMSAKNSGSRFPAAKVRAVEELKWYLDKAAASKIKMP